MRKVNSTLAVTILLILFVLGNQVFAGQVITVDDDGPADYSTIQDAIDTAVDGDTVVVADGTYSGEGNRDIDFAGKAITLQSENGPDNCIIDCQGSEDEPHRGFYFHNDEDANSILDGLTIKNGYANIGGGILGEQVKPVITNCVITGNVAQYNGGGIFTCDGLITNCTISENSAGDRGGGLYRCGGQISNCTIKDNSSLDSGGGGLYDCDGPITECIITGNSAISGIDYHGRGGGLLYCDGTINDCVIRGNYAQSLGGGLEWCSGLIINCTISDNSTQNSGGGLHRCYGSIVNCVICNNSAGKSGGGLYGVGSVIKCTISGNSAGTCGGGLYYCKETIAHCAFIDNSAKNGGALANCEISITNCNFISNIAEEKGGGLIYCDSLITNCIFVNNTKQAIYEIPYSYVSKTHSPAVSYCLFYDNPDGDWYDLETSTVFTGAAAINEFPEVDNNIDENPLFELNSYNLQTGSPCINAGDPNYSGPDGTDIDGLPRVDGCRVDIGAYEYECDPEIPIIVVLNKSFTFTARENEADPQPQTLSLFNCNNSTLQWYLESDSSWLKTTVASGTSTGNINDIAIEVDINSLSHGTHTGVLTIFNEQDTSNIEYVSITLQVLSTLLVPEQYPTIQSAIDDALDGDVIMVADATYTGDGNRDIDFLGKAITVKSENGSENCVIDCNGTENEPHRGFYFHNDEDANSILDGFTIKNGFAGAGGGILCDSASPMITNCTIVDNQASASLLGLIRDLRMVRNSGGGMCCQNSSATINNCIIVGNIAKTRGGGICCVNYGMVSIKERVAINERLTITNCYITNNRTLDMPVPPLPLDPRLSLLEPKPKSGGGIYCDGDTIIRNTVITGNSAYNGAGVYCHSETTVENCTIYGNHADNLGGGIYCWLTQILSPLSSPAAEEDCAEITNCILWDNFAEQGSQLALDSRKPLLIKPISVKPTLIPSSPLPPSSPREVDYTNLIVAYSNIQDAREAVYIGEDVNYIEEDSPLIWGQGNIDTDPLFADPGYWDTNGTPDDANDDILVDGDYRLLWDSPCIDAGDPNYTPEVNETDLDGNPRVIGGRIDMGAYESDHMEVQLWISPKTIHRHNQRMKKIMAWFRLPKGVTKDQINRNKLLVLYPEDEPNGIEAIKQFIIQHGRPGNRRTSIIAFFDKAELMSTVHDNGKVELEVVGNLTSGQYFYGTDTVWIKARRWPRWHRR